MQDRIKDLVASINDGSLQQEICAKLKRHPVIHFSDHAETIMKEGFLLGESNLSRMDCTYENAVPRSQSSPGYNFAFNAVEWDVENDCMDYEIAGPMSERNLMGMYSETAILLNVDGLYTRHYDEFKQVLFWGPSAKLADAILLKNTGTLEIDGEVACDDNGNPVDCWIAVSSKGEVIAEPEDLLSLRECVLKSLVFMDAAKTLSKQASSAYREAYANEIEEMELDLPAAAPATKRHDSESSFDF